MDINTFESWIGTENNGEFVYVKAFESGANEDLTYRIFDQSGEFVAIARMDRTDADNQNYNFELMDTEWQTIFRIEPENDNMVLLSREFVNKGELDHGFANAPTDWYRKFEELKFTLADSVESSISDGQLIETHERYLDETWDTLKEIVTAKGVVTVFDQNGNIVTQSYGEDILVSSADITDDLTAHGIAAINLPSLVLDGNQIHFTIIEQGENRGGEFDQREILFFNGNDASVQDFSLLGSMKTWAWFNEDDGYQGFGAEYYDVNGNNIGRFQQHNDGMGSGDRWFEITNIDQSVISEVRGEYDVYDYSPDLDTLQVSTQLFSNETGDFLGELNQSGGLTLQYDSNWDLVDISVDIDALISAEDADTLDEFKLYGQLTDLNSIQSGIIYEPLVAILERNSATKDWLQTDGIGKFVYTASIDSADTEYAFVFDASGNVFGYASIDSYLDDASDEQNLKFNLDLSVFDINGEFIASAEQFVDVNTGLSDLTISQKGFTDLPKDPDLAIEYAEEVEFVRSEEFHISNVTILGDLDDDFTFLYAPLTDDVTSDDTIYEEFINGKRIYREEVNGNVIVAFKGDDPNPHYSFNVSEIVSNANVIDYLPSVLIAPENLVNSITSQDDDRIETFYFQDGTNSEAILLGKTVERLDADNPRLEFFSFDDESNSFQYIGRAREELKEGITQVDVNYNYSVGNQAFTLNAEYTAGSTLNSLNSVEFLSYSEFLDNEIQYKQVIDNGFEYVYGANYVLADGYPKLVGVNPQDLLTSKAAFNEKFEFLDFSFIPEALLSEDNLYLRQTDSWSSNNKQNTNFELYEVSSGSLSLVGYLYSRESSSDDQSSYLFEDASNSTLASIYVNEEPDNGISINYSYENQDGIETYTNLVLDSEDFTAREALLDYVRSVRTDESFELFSARDGSLSIENIDYYYDELLSDGELVSSTEYSVEDATITRFQDGEFSQELVAAALDATDDALFTVIAPASFFAEDGGAYVSSIPNIEIVDTDANGLPIFGATTASLKYYQPSENGQTASLIGEVRVKFYDADGAPFAINSLDEAIYSNKMVFDAFIYDTPTTTTRIGGGSYILNDNSTSDWKLDYVYEEELEGGVSGEITEVRRFTTNFDEEFEAYYSSYEAKVGNVSVYKQESDGEKTTITEAGVTRVDYAPMARFEVDQISNLPKFDAGGHDVQFTLGLDYDETKNDPDFEGELFDLVENSYNSWLASFTADLDQNVWIVSDQWLNASYRGLSEAELGIQLNASDEAFETVSGEIMMPWTLRVGDDVLDISATRGQNIWFDATPYSDSFWDAGLAGSLYFTTTVESGHLDIYGAHASEYTSSMYGGPINVGSSGQGAVIFASGDVPDDHPWGYITGEFLDPNDIDAEKNEVSFPNAQIINILSDSNLVVFDTLNYLIAPFSSSRGSTLVGEQDDPIWFWIQPDNAVVSQNEGDFFELHSLNFQGEDSDVIIYGYNSGEAISLRLIQPITEDDFDMVNLQAEYDQHADLTYISFDKNEYTQESDVADSVSFAVAGAFKIASLHNNRRPDAIEILLENIDGDPVAGRIFVNNAGSGYGADNLIASGKLSITDDGAIDQLEISLDKQVENPDQSDQTNLDKLVASGALESSSLSAYIIGKDDFGSIFIDTSSGRYGYIATANNLGGSPKGSQSYFELTVADQFNWTFQDLRFPIIGSDSAADLSGDSGNVANLYENEEFMGYGKYDGYLDIRDADGDDINIGIYYDASEKFINLKLPLNVSGEFHNIVTDFGRLEFIVRNDPDNYNEYKLEYSFFLDSSKPIFDVLDRDESEQLEFNIFASSDMSLSTADEFEQASSDKKNISININGSDEQPYTGLYNSASRIIGSDSDFASLDISGYVNGPKLDDANVIIRIVSQGTTLTEYTVPADLPAVGDFQSGFAAPAEFYAFVKTLQDGNYVIELVSDIGFSDTYREQSPIRSLDLSIGTQPLDPELISVRHGYEESGDSENIVTDTQHVIVEGLYRGPDHHKIVVAIEGEEYVATVDWNGHWQVDITESSVFNSAIENEGFHDIEVYARVGEAKSNVITHEFLIDAITDTDNVEKDINIFTVRMNSDQNFNDFENVTSEWTVGTVAIDMIHGAPNGLSYNYNNDSEFYSIDWSVESGETRIWAYGENILQAQFVDATHGNLTSLHAFAIEQGNSDVAIFDGDVAIFDGENAQWIDVLRFESLELVYEQVYADQSSAIEALSTDSFSDYEEYDPTADEPLSSLMPLGDMSLSYSVGGDIEIKVAGLAPDAYKSDDFEAELHYVDGTVETLDGLWTDYSAGLAMVAAADIDEGLVEIHVRHEADGVDGASDGDTFAMLEASYDITVHYAVLDNGDGFNFKGSVTNDTQDLNDLRELFEAVTIDEEIFNLYPVPEGEKYGPGAENVLFSAYFNAPEFDVNDSKTTISVQENEDISINIVELFSDIDLKGHFELVDSIDASAFKITNGSTATITSIAPLDHEYQSQYIFEFYAIDYLDNKSDTIQVTINVNDVDEDAPEITIPTSAFDVVENSTFVKVLSATDDSDIFWEIVDEFGAINTNSPFEINGSGSTLKFTQAPDFEVDPIEYTVYVRAVDSLGNASAPVNLAVNVTDEDETIPDTEAPVITLPSELTLEYGSPDADRPDNVLEFFANEEVTWRVLGEDQQYVSIEPYTGILRILPEAQINADIGDLEIKIEAVDNAGNSSIKPVIIPLVHYDADAPIIERSFDGTLWEPFSSDPVDGPLRTSVEYSENSDTVYLNYWLKFTDNSSVNVSLKGADADLFDIDPATGQLFFKDNSLVDYESNQTGYFFEVVATDVNGNEDSTEVLVNIIDDPSDNSKNPVQPTLEVLGSPSNEITLNNIIDQTLSLSGTSYESSEPVNVTVSIFTHDDTRLKTIEATVAENGDWHIGAQELSSALKQTIIGDNDEGRPIEDDTNIYFGVDSEISGELQSFESLPYELAGYDGLEVTYGGIDEYVNEVSDVDRSFDFALSVNDELGLGINTLKVAWETGDGALQWHPLVFVNDFAKFSAKYGDWDVTLNDTADGSTINFLYKYTGIDALAGYGSAKDNLKVMLVDGWGSETIVDDFATIYINNEDNAFTMAMDMPFVSIDSNDLGVDGEFEVKFADIIPEMPQDVIDDGKALWMTDGARGTYLMLDEYSLQVNDSADDTITAIRISHIHPDIVLQLDGVEIVDGQKIDLSTYPMVMVYTKLDANGDPLSVPDTREKLFEFTYFDTADNETAERGFYYAEDDSSASMSAYDPFDSMANKQVDLEIADIELSEAFVEDVLKDGNLANARDLNVSFNVLSLPDVGDTSDVKIVIFEDKDQDAVHDTGSERLLVAEFSVTHLEEENGMATIMAPSDVTITYGRDSANLSMPKVLTNVQTGELLTVQQGMGSLPNSLSVKLSSLLNKVSEFVPGAVDVLSDPGTYRLEVSGLPVEVAAPTNDVFSVGKISGNLEVIEDPLKVEDVKFIHMGNDGGKKVDDVDFIYDLQGSVSLDEIVLSVKDVATFGTADFTSPEISLTLKDTLSGTDLTPSILRFELYDRTGLNPDAFDQGERKIDISLDILRYSDGNVENIAATSDEIDYSIMTSSGLATIGTFANDPEDDAYRFIEGSESTVDVKVLSLLSKLQSEGVAVPSLSMGDEFNFNLYLDEEQILDGTILTPDIL